MAQRTFHFRVVSPGAVTRRVDIEAAAKALRLAGHSVTFGLHLFDSHRYLAGTVASRLSDLRSALEDDSVDAVWFARGGFGSAQLLPYLEMGWFVKPVIGYSDNTSLLGRVAESDGVAIHGPVFEEILEPKTAPDSIETGLIKEDAWRVVHLLSGNCANVQNEAFSLTSMGPWPVGPITGPTWGGNLTTLTSLVGTPWAQSFRGALLLLEDVGEPFYRIERMLDQLVQSNAMSGAAAVVLGDFHNCPKRGVLHSIEDIFLERLSPLSVPVFAGAPFGHGARNRPWRLGSDARLDSNGLFWNK